MKTSAAELPIAERQRWIAAAALAAGEPMARAAAKAEMSLGWLRSLAGTDPDFQELLAAEVEQAALPPEEWRRRTELQHRQAIERALADGRIAAVGAQLRLGSTPSAPTRHKAGRRATAEEAAPPGDAGDVDDEAWLAGLPVVEPDPEREAERRRALLKVEPLIVRRAVGHAPLRQLEQYLVAGDPVAYEEWFARQPKPPRRPAASLTAEDAAAVEWVTRHNPPWIRGEYLGYYRPPVPAHFFQPEAGDADRPAAGARADPPPPPAENPVAGLRARIVRLLDRSAPRLPEEADLAEAVCALKWPKWPSYGGSIDPLQLRRALSDVRLDDTTLNWLGSREFARACRAAVTPSARP